MRDIVWLNDGLIPAPDALVPIADRGLLYGDGLFETMRARGARVHLLARHLRRLRQSAAIIELELPDDHLLRRAIASTLGARHEAITESPSAATADAHSGDDDVIVRLTVTRGEGGMGAAPRHESTPTLLVTLRPLLRNANPFSAGHLRLLGTPHHYPSTLARIKSTSYLTSVLGGLELRRRGGSEGVMVTEAGHVAEGTVSNIFIVRDGALSTPPLDLGVLPGIARARVVELARAASLAVREERFDVEALRAADECFTTNAARGVTPALSLDGKRFAIDAPGPVTRFLHERYASEIASETL